MCQWRSEELKHMEHRPGLETLRVLLLLRIARTFWEREELVEAACWVVLVLDFLEAGDVLAVDGF